MELVVFLSCFHSFQQEAKHHQAALRLIQKEMFYCQDLLDLGFSDLRVTEGIPRGLIFTIRTTETWEPITVTIVPAYRALGKGTDILHAQPANLRRLLPTASGGHMHSSILPTSWAGAELPQCAQDSHTRSWETETYHRGTL